MKMNSPDLLNELLEPYGITFDPFGKPIIPVTDTSVYAYGCLIRKTEEKILDLFSKGLLSGTTHTCLGQELCQMSVVRALTDPDDVVLSNHRNHGHFVTYSGNPLGIIAEIMGREAGVCRGYGGSQHIAYRHFHSNGVQGGMTAIGVGLAKARKLNGSQGIVATVVGDGTLGEGLLYESMNLASIWDLPVLFVVENNGIAQTTYTDAVIGGQIEDRGRAFGLSTWTLDDSAQDFLKDVEEVVNQVRSSSRPGLLTIRAQRLGPHSKGDDLRSDAEKQKIKKRDPLTAVGRKLAEELRLEIESSVDKKIKEIEQLALASPTSTLSEVPENVFSAPFEFDPIQLSQSGASEGNVRSDLNAALHKLLDGDPKSLLIGEDLHDPYGGAFKVTEGLSSKFPDRVISTPISEAGITGAAIGLALDGYRPIVEIMFADFMTLCMDQIYNHAVKFPAMFESCPVPMIIRTPCGGRRGYGPTHSQSVENLFVSIPGLTVVYPSNRHPAGKMLEEISRHWPHPVLFLEHKLLYGEERANADYLSIPVDSEEIGSGLFPILRSGSESPDITIVTYGGMLTEVEKAAARLAEEEELQVEIVVPSLLSPLQQTLTDELQNRPSILVAEESHSANGFGAELLARMAESGFQGNIGRLGTNPIPIAAARSMENQILVDHNDVFHSAIDLLS